MRSGVFFHTTSGQMRQIFFRMPGGYHVAIDVETPNSTTLHDVQKKLFYRTGLPVTRQRLVCNGKQCVNTSKTIWDLGWPHGITVHTHVRWHGVGCPCGWCSQSMLLRDGTRVGVGKNDMFDYMFQ